VLTLDLDYHLVGLNATSGEFLRNFTTMQPVSVVRAAGNILVMWDSIGKTVNGTSIATGKSLWSMALFSEGVVFASSADGVVFMMDVAKGNVLALQASTGKVRWTTAISRTQSSGWLLLSGDGKSLFCPGSQSMVSLDAASGAKQWSTPQGVLGNVKFAEDGGFGRLIIVGNQASIGQTYLAAVDASSGAVIWSDDSITQAVPAVAADGSVVAMSSSLVRLDGETGAQIWANRFVGSISWIAIGPAGTIYSSQGPPSDPQALDAYDISNGNSLWSQAFSNAADPASVYAIDDDGSVFFSTGRQLVKFETFCVQNHARATFEHLNSRSLRVAAPLDAPRAGPVAGHWPGQHGGNGASRRVATRPACATQNVSAWASSSYSLYRFPPILSDDGSLVLNQFSNGSIMALSASTGEAVRVLGQASRTSPIRATRAAGNILIAHDNQTGIIFAISISTGEQLWSMAAAPGDVGMAASADGNLFLGLPNGTGKLLVVNVLTGEAKWSVRTTQPPSGLLLSLDGSRLIYGESSVIVCRDPKSGRILWRATPAHSTPGVVGSIQDAGFGRVVLQFSVGSTLTSVVYALNVTSGKLLWQFYANLPGQGTLFFRTPAAVAEDGSIVLGGTVRLGFEDLTGMLFRLDGATGNTVWSTATDAQPAWPAIGPDGTIIVSGQMSFYDPPGAVAAFDFETGALQWARLWPGVRADSIPVAIADDGAVFFAMSHIHKLASSCAA